MKSNYLKPLLWLILFGLLAWFGTAIPAAADGGGFPTATLTITPIRLFTATSPFGGAVTPVIAITPVGKDQPLSAGDQAVVPQQLQPTMFGATSQETTQTSRSNMILFVGGLVVAAALLAFLLIGFLRRNREN